MSAQLALGLSILWVLLQVTNIKYYGTLPLLLFCSLSIIGQDQKSEKHSLSFKVQLAATREKE